MLKTESQQYLKRLLKPNYPCYSSLDEAVEKVNLVLLEQTRDEVHAALSIYQNSLVHQILIDLNKLENTNGS